jgi:hypothetical protein
MEVMDETCLFNLVSELLDADAILLGELQSTYDALDDDAVIEEPKCLAAACTVWDVSREGGRYEGRGGIEGGRINDVATWE